MQTQQQQQLKTVPVISLWQPWGSLVIRGLKQYETRSWQTSLRGWFGIHAARQPFKSAGQDGLFLQQLANDQVRWLSMPYGVLLGFVKLVACVPVETVRHEISRREQLYGNYDNGRFAWKLADPRPLPEPIEMKGRQGFFNHQVDPFWLRDVLAGEGE